MLNFPRGSHIPHMLQRPRDCFHQPRPLGVFGAKALRVSRLGYWLLVTGYRLCSIVYSILRGYSPLARPLARGAGTSAVGCLVGRSRL